MKLNQPLDQLFSNEARTRILRTLFRFPGEFTGRHIARLADLPHPTARLALIGLVNNDILMVKHAGKSKLYSLNTDNIMYEALTKLFKAEASIMDELRNKFLAWVQGAPQIREELVHASVYGSTARGDEQPDSDIDILLVLENDIDAGILDKALEPFHSDILKLYGNSLHIFTWMRPKHEEAFEELPILREIAQYGVTIYGEDLVEVLRAWNSE